ncbi:hypothetical protein [Cystobacter fuscus]|uniref:hypothetical protein n=1 Tax=Cystobacter fuscus TaxID=43 RepID=UPI002B28C9F5|nr:hypothetical protein F0U63_06035 [Cystobacter fuscus]
MIFSIQRFVEDYFSRRSWDDDDQFAVAIANLYASRRWDVRDVEFLVLLGRLRTVFYKRNKIKDKKEFGRVLLCELDRKFLKKKDQVDPDAVFAGGLKAERRAVKRLKRKSMRVLLEKFSLALRSKAVDSFWVSRKKGRLRQRPESIAQSHLAVFLYAVLDGNGAIFREVGSGTGYVDLLVVLSRVVHLIEVKVLTGRFEGPSQLASYMEMESRQEAWLVVLDARPQKRQAFVQERFVLPVGVVNTVVVNLNPVAPSRT